MGVRIEIDTHFHPSILVRPSHRAGYVSIAVMPDPEDEDDTGYGLLLSSDEAYRLANAMKQISLQMEEI
jgi:hypothetical protein